MRTPEGRTCASLGGSATSAGARPLSRACRGASVGKVADAEAEALGPTLAEEGGLADWMGTVVSAVSTAGADEAEVLVMSGPGALGASVAVVAQPVKKRLSQRVRTPAKYTARAAAATRIPAARMRSSRVKQAMEELGRGRRLRATTVAGTGDVAGPNPMRYSTSMATDSDLSAEPTLAVFATTIARDPAAGPSTPSESSTETSSPTTSWSREMVAWS